MIWNEELSASLDQSGGVVVFHRIELSRTQQLTQVISEKVASLVDQNEKSLDIKMGGTSGWGDRNDSSKTEKRGEQTQERRGRGDRTRGIRGTFIRYPGLFPVISLLIARWWGPGTGFKIFPRTGKSDAQSYGTGDGTVVQ